MDGHICWNAGLGTHVAQRFRLAWVVLLFSGATLIASASVAAAEAPAIENEVEYPDLKGIECTSGADVGINIGFSVAKQCAQRYGDRIGEYLRFVPQAVFAVVEPVTAPWFTAEISSKLTKDAKICVLSGLVEGIGGSPAEQSAVTATFESYLAIDSAQKFATGLRQGANLFMAAREHGRKYLMQDQSLRKELGDFRKFAFYADKKLDSLARNATKPGQAVGAAGNAFDAWFNTAEARTKAALADAEQAIGECNFEAARARLEAAQIDSREWLTLVRRDVSRTRKQLWCEEQRIFGDSRRAIDGDSPFARKTLADAEAAVKNAEAADLSIVAYRKDLYALAGRFDAEERAIVEQRAGFQKVIDQARAALTSCDLNAAQRHVDSLKNALSGNRCNQMTQTGPTGYADTFDFNTLGLLQAEISERKTRIPREAQELRAEYDAAMASTPKTTYDCSTLNLTADFLERWASEDSCRDRLDAAAKATGLRNKAAACLLAVQQPTTPLPVTPPTPITPPTIPTPPSGPALLTGGAPLPDAPDAQWKSVAPGMIVYENYSGDYIARGEYSWGGPPAEIGPNGFTITLTAKCKTGKLQPRMSTGIGMDVGNLEIEAPGKPGPNGEPAEPVILQRVEVPIDCEINQERSNSLTLRVRPRKDKRFAPGETASVHIGGFWGKEVRYVYTAKGTQ